MQIAEILLIEKGKRPDPSQYLSQDYINNHLAQFDNGAIRFASLEAVKKYGTVGPQGRFVLPKKDFDRIIHDFKGNFNDIENHLGLDKGTLSNSDTGIFYIPKEQLNNLRIPSGNEGGANSQWIPGGKTSGGINETVVDFNKDTKVQLLEVK
jgi:filamentous hemagglutinin